MPDSPVNVTRWTQFTEPETVLLKKLLATTCDIILKDDPEDMGVEEAKDKAATLVLAGEMLYSIDDHYGNEHPTEVELGHVAAALASRQSMTSLMVGDEEK